MSWVARKIDSLIGAVFGAIAGASASQFDAFMLQYLQRLGGHLDEARRNYGLVMDGERYRDMAVEVRTILIADARARMDELELSWRAIADADLLHRPWAFARHVDAEIAARTWETFRPVLPFDATGLIYAACGLVIGLIVYELLKAPFALLFGRRRGTRMAR
jgi:hypothetical protein